MMASHFIRSARICSACSELGQPSGQRQSLGMSSVGMVASKLNLACALAIAMAWDLGSFRRSADAGFAVVTSVFKQLGR